MRGKFIVLGVLAIGLTIAFLPELVWPAFPGRWLMGCIGGVGGVGLLLLAGLYAGEFRTASGVVRRGEMPGRFYGQVALLAAILIAMSTVLIVARPF